MKLSIREFREAAAAVAGINLDEVRAAVASATAAMDELEPAYAEWKAARFADDDPEGYVSDRLAAAIEALLAANRRSRGKEAS